MLIKIINSGSSTGSGGNTIPAGISYFGFSQGSVTTNTSNAIVGFSVTNGAALTAVTPTGDIRVQVGNLGDGGTFRPVLDSQ